MRARLALIVALAAIGCYHDKYNVNGPQKEEYHLPPDEARYNMPDTAAYRKPATLKQQDTLMNKMTGGGGGRPLGGNGLGGF
jgi:hypothetical protein